jgi:hypothetical protein
VPHERHALAFFVLGFAQASDRVLGDPPVVRPRMS